jgi:predicted transcriptional regulator of viral defense system
MKYIDFYEQFKDLPFIDVSDIKTAFPDYEHRRMYEWQKAGYIKKITRGFYVFADKFLNEDEICFVANKLREPSYVSMEYALNHYGLIPEAVFTFTSITTKKTASFETSVGNFSYQSVKKPLFFGYVLTGIEKSKYKIAEPEKALLDFLYLRRDLISENDIEDLRINADIYKEIVDEDKLRQYLAVFGLATLNKKVGLLMEYIKKHD